MNSPNPDGRRYPRKRVGPRSNPLEGCQAHGGRSPAGPVEHGVMHLAEEVRLEDLDLRAAKPARGWKHRGIEQRVAGEIRSIDSQDSRRVQRGRRGGVNSEAGMSRGWGSACRTPPPTPAFGSPGNGTRLREVLQAPLWTVRPCRCLLGRAASGLSLEQGPRRRALKQRRRPGLDVLFCSFGTPF